MNTVQEFVLECDLFSHSSLQRYKQEESYRTLVGGIVSIILIILFFSLFSSLMINTFSKNIINSQISTNYDDDPTYSQLTASPKNNYMFAIGLTGIDLSSTQRYFDIVLTNRTYTNNGGTIKKNINTIPLAPCTLSQWSGISDSIKNSYTNLNFNQWLCLPMGQVLPLQGKYTSNTFKFAQIIISQCTNNALYPGTTCKSSTDISTFLSTNSQFTFNIYYINPVINPGNPTFITYYLEDSNYFSFDTYTGISANLFFSDFTVATDNSIFPWAELTSVSGMETLQTAVGQIYQIQSSSNQYFKFNFRKAASNIQISRTFQKFDQTLSYIGGLFGFITLFLFYLKLYSKYSYQLDIGDKIFQQNTGGSFGSENFNFIVFLGYLLFNVFTKFNVYLNWKTMKKYHKCRQQCQKQLNIDLLLKKIAHFEQIFRIILDDHHIKTLMLIPKPTILQAKVNRKRYLIKSIIYHQLQRKSRDVFVEKDEYKQRFNQFLKSDRDEIAQNIVRERYKDESSMKAIQNDFVTSYKKIQEQNQGNQKSAKKILNRLKVEDLVKAAFNLFSHPVQQNYENEMERKNPTIQKNQIFPSLNSLNSLIINDNLEQRVKQIKQIYLLILQITDESYEISLYLLNCCYVYFIIKIRKILGFFPILKITINLCKFFLN